MSKGRIVAVVSDFGADSFYVGVMKGVVMAAAPDCRVVDLTHSIPPHAVVQASFILDIVFDCFPPGTVFLAVVDPGVGGGRENLVVEADGRYLVLPDNGIATEVLARAGYAAHFAIDEGGIGPFRMAGAVGRTFLGRDVFAPAASALAAGLPPDRIGGPARAAPVRLQVPAVEVVGDVVRGPVRYVDGFGNLLTGVSADHLTSVFGGGDPSRFAASVDGHDLGELCTHYSQRQRGDLMAVMNSWGRVEVSMREGRAADRYSGHPLEEVVVEVRSAPGR